MSAKKKTASTRGQAQYLKGSQRTNYMTATAASTRRKSVAPRPGITRSTFIPPTAERAGVTKQTIEIPPNAERPGVAKETIETPDLIETNDIDGPTRTMSEPSQVGVKDICSTTLHSSGQLLSTRAASHVNDDSTIDENGDWLHLRSPIERQYYRMLRLKHMSGHSRHRNHLPSVAHIDGYTYLEDDEIADKLRYWGCHLHDICPEDQLEAFCRRVKEEKIRLALVADPDLSLRGACQLSDLEHVPGEPTSRDIEDYLQVNRLNIDPEYDWTPDPMFEERDPEEIPGLLEGVLVKIFNHDVSDVTVVNKVVVSAKKLLAFKTELESAAEASREKIEELECQLHTASKQINDEIDNSVAALRTANADLEEDAVHQLEQFQSLQEHLEVCKREKLELEMESIALKKKNYALENQLFTRSREIAKQNNVISELQTTISNLQRSTNDAFYSRAAINGLTSLDEDLLRDFERSIFGPKNVMPRKFNTFY